MPNAKLWRFRIIFCAILYLIISIIAAPVTFFPATVPIPDAIYCFSVAWLVRRPEFVLSVAVVAATFFIELMLLQTPGVWSALMLLLCEYFRRISERLRTTPFWLEWAIAAAYYSLAQVITNVALAVVFLPFAPPEVILMNCVATALLYPMFVLLTNVLFRVKKPRPANLSLFGSTTVYRDAL